MIQELVDEVPDLELGVIAAKLQKLIETIHKDIPERKRVSKGRYSIVKVLGMDIYPMLEAGSINVLDFGKKLFQDSQFDPFVRSTGVQLCSLVGFKTGDLDQALSVIKQAAGDENWIVRECASGLVRKLIKAYPGEMRTWYLKLVKSKDPLLRRFVSESMRPVVENKWFKKDPEYVLGIIKQLFRETEEYPRTSIGNNLSDWMRVDQEVAWPIVSELAKNGDPNSYWIAYRACRNYVKTEPEKVMDLLGVDEYKYKSTIYKRN
jgi:3-methyladenine DNA glycosylase AlkC